MQMKLLELKMVQGFYLDRSKNMPKSHYELAEEKSDKVVYRLTGNSN